MNANPKRITVVAVLILAIGFSSCVNNKLVIHSNNREKVDGQETIPKLLKKSPLYTADINLPYSDDNMKYLNSYYHNKNDNIKRIGFATIKNDIIEMEPIADGETVRMRTVFKSETKHEGMLRELDPRNFNKDYTEYDQTTALFNAQLSELSYWNENKIDKFYQQAIVEYPDQEIHYRFLECQKKCNHVQALLWGTKDFLVIALRGTEPKVITDWITDGKFWNYENTPEANEALANMPPGHGGFRKSLMNLINKNDLFGNIEGIIKQCNPNADLTTFPIYLTGHSLGAAISQLLMEPLLYKQFNLSGAYHFAPPLAVSCSVNETFKQKFGNKTYDIVNYNDYVPRAGRNAVSHFGIFLRICKNDLIYKEKESYIKFKRKEYLSEFRLHSLKNHIKAIRKSENTNQNILQRSSQTYNCLVPENDVNFCPD